MRPNWRKCCFEGSLLAYGVFQKGFIKLIRAGEFIMYKSRVSLWGQFRLSGYFRPYGSRRVLRRRILQDPRTHSRNTIRCLDDHRLGRLDGLLQKRSRAETLPKP